MEYKYTKDCIEIKDTALSKIYIPVFGFGPAIIRVRAGIFIETVNCFLFGFRVKITTSNDVHKIE